MTTVATPAKWPGRDAPSRRSASAPGSTLVSGSPPGYISLTEGANKSPTPAACGHGQVPLQVGRVPCQVRRGRELERVHEDARRHHVAARRRCPQERHVPLMERTHRRHEAKSRACCAHGRRRLSELVAGGDHLHEPAPALPIRSPRAPSPRLAGPAGGRSGLFTFAGPRSRADARGRPRRRNRPALPGPALGGDARSWPGPRVRPDR